MKYWIIEEKRDYTEYVDERIIDLEEKFIELNYMKERILNYDSHNNKLLQTNEQYIQFIKNTYKKIIRKKIEDLKELLVICNNNGLIVRNKLISLKNEIDTIIQKYEHELLVTEIEQPYKEYTTEEVENLTFNNKNAIIFLNGEKDKKLYEEGLLKNGENKNKIINESSRADLKLIMYLLVNNTIQLSNSSYGRFIDNIQYKRKNGSWDDVRINDKSLKRASLNHKQARISLIRLKVAEENKRKLGISSNQGVILILGAYEINFGNEEETYNQMFAEARYFEEKISKIMQIFENPNTPKETLLKYIADSYGLLQHLIEGTSTQDLNQTIETEQTDKNKRGGRN